MRSSISNSDAKADGRATATHLVDSAEGRLPQGGWARSWALATFLALSCLIGLEVMVRARGFVPTIEGDKDLWCFQREVASRGGEDSIAILGTSRTTAGFDTSLIRREYPGRDIAMLALHSTHPVAVLEDLADDPKFRGVALCEIFSASIMPDNWETQRPWVDYYHGAWRAERKVDRSLRLIAEEGLALTSPGTLPDALQLLRGAVPTLLGRRPGGFPRPTPRGRRFRADGSMTIDYSVVDARGVEDLALRNWTKYINDLKPIDEKGWAARVALLAGVVDRIHRKGGRVAFVNFPLGGQLKALMESTFPRKQYWDVLARGTAAEAIDCDDVPALDGYRPADGLHLGREDAGRFTASLLDELRKRKVLPAIGDRAPTP